MLTSAAATVASRPASCPREVLISSATTAAAVPSSWLFVYTSAHRLKIDVIQGSYYQRRTFGAVHSCEAACADAHTQLIRYYLPDKKTPSSRTLQPRLMKPPGCACNLGVQCVSSSLSPE